MLKSFAHRALTGLCLFLLPGSGQAGDPVPGVDVSLEQQPGGKRFTATSDNTGKVTFKLVDPGNYLVVVSAKKDGGGAAKTQLASGEEGIEVSLSGKSTSTFSSAKSARGSSCTPMLISDDAGSKKSNSSVPRTAALSADSTLNQPACVGMSVLQRQPVVIVLQTIDHNSGRSNVGQ